MSKNTYSMINKKKYRLIANVLKKNSHETTSQTVIIIHV